MLAVIAWVYSWWVTAAVPLPVTSMCPKFNRAVVLTVVYATPIGGISTSQFALIQFLESDVTWVFLNMVLLRFSCCHSLPLLFWCIVCFLYVPKDSSRALSSLSFDIPGWGACFHGLVGDGSVSVMVAVLLFIIPNKKQEGEKLMDWNERKKLPWNLILLLGAGFALADGVQSSGLADVLSRALDFLEDTPYWAIAPAVSLMSSIITEFITSNDATATATLLIPLLYNIAKTMHVHPLLLMVPGAVATAFLLPTSTPSNVVGFATGHIEILDMLKIGVPLKVAGIAVLSIFMPTLGAIVFGTDDYIQWMPNINSPWLRN
ncbi:hypothetical protein AAZX31_07G247300 [Glycine max]|nr:hypothetical protein GLYMA_07G265900v4 [Glycine max]KAH1088793.1 hypothetical protein GYH30_019683 [Glycine max]RZC04817.1 Tonoplast dicarboxylate transporter [Glycine soja]